MAKKKPKPKTEQFMAPSPTRTYKVVEPLDLQQIQLAFTAATFAGLIAKEGIEVPTVRVGGRNADIDPMRSLESKHYRKAQQVGARVAKMYQKEN